MRKCNFVAAVLLGIAAAVWAQSAPTTASADVSAEVIRLTRENTLLKERLDAKIPKASTGIVSREKYEALRNDRDVLSEQLFKTMEDFSRLQVEVQNMKRQLEQMQKGLPSTMP